MENDQLKSIIEDLRNVRGLKPIQRLGEEHKHVIRRLEDKANTGVFACLAREHTLLVTHDSSFREPVSDIVLKKESTLLFPPVAFPEVKATRVVSSSPSEPVHEALLKTLNFSLAPKEATLLIGFDL